MDDRQYERYETRAAVIKAMGHPTRLFMVEELSGGERCVCELTEMIGADTSTVSKHLSVLKNAGLVEDRKEGLNVFYRLRCPCVLDFFDCIEAVLKLNISENRDALRVRKRKPKRRIPSGPGMSGR